MKKFCLILGMGRSGTSMLSGVLDILGINFPDKTKFKNGFNPKGYYEDLQLIAYNEMILNVFTKSPPPEWVTKLRGAIPPIKWLHPPVLPENWVQKTPPQIRATIKSIMASYNQFTYPGVKDPRISLVLPLYLEIFKELNYEPKIIIIERRPEEVAKSLYKFHDYKMPKENVLAVCKRYYDDLKVFTQGMDFAHVYYHDLVDKPIEKSAELAKYLELPFDENAKLKVNNFVDKNLYHNKN